LKINYYLILVLAYPAQEDIHAVLCAQSLKPFLKFVAMEIIGDGT
jgi:hypothetical protein